MQFHSRIIPEARLLQGILGLRGMAALAVVMFHLCKLTDIHAPAGFYFIESNFGAGPLLFFVLSAYSLMHSTEHTMHRTGWAGEYLIKRIFRIAPLFYTVLAAMLAWIAFHAVRTGTALPDIALIFLNVTFLFSFFPRMEYSFVQAGWTVGVEMIFYLLFPLLLMTIRSGKQAMLFFLIAVTIGFATNAEMEAFNPGTASQFGGTWGGHALLAFLYFFAAGIYAYRLEQALTAGGKNLQAWVPWFAVIAIGLLLQFEKGRSLINLGILYPVVIALGFAALCVWQGARPNKWFANKVLEYLGERSFSIYLLHPLMINSQKDFLFGVYSRLEPAMGAYAYFICAMLVLVELLLVAEVTYRAIEVPGIVQGRRIIKKMRDRALSAD